MPAQPVLSKRTVLAWVALLGSTIAVPSAAQQTSESDPVYRREVFVYPRAQRPDPFRSLLGTAELGLRFEDLALRGVVYNPNPRESVVVLSEAGSDRRIRARVGDRVGGITILAVYPRRVDLLVTEFGVSRRETLELKAAPKKGTES